MLQIMSSGKRDRTQKVNRWYFGGLASAGAACCTHPLDLLKVHLQTSGKGEKIGIIAQTIKIVRHQGILAMYNGLSASLLRQITYSTTRFAVYEVSCGDDKPFCAPVSRFPPLH